LQIVAKAEQGNLGLDWAGGLLSSVQGELDLLGHDQRTVRIAADSEGAGHGAEVAAGAHQKWRPVSLVDGPAAANSPNGPDRLPEFQASAGSPEKVVVKLAPADAEADRRLVVDPKFRSSDPARAKARNRLEDSPPAVVGAIHLKGIKDLRGNPPGAKLVARKGCLVEHEYVEPCVAQTPGAGRSGRSSANDEYVAGLHRLVSRRARILVQPFSRPRNLVDRRPGEDDLK
jgi:hypothetical protein